MDHLIYDATNASGQFFGVDIIVNYSLYLPDDQDYTVEIDNDKIFDVSSGDLNSILLVVKITDAAGNPRNDNLRCAIAGKIEVSQAEIKVENYKLLPREGKGNLVNDVNKDFILVLLHDQEFDVANNKHMKHVKCIGQYINKKNKSKHVEEHLKNCNPKKEKIAPPSQPGSTGSSILINSKTISTE